MNVTVGVGGKKEAMDNPNINHKEVKLNCKKSELLALFCIKGWVHKDFNLTNQNNRTNIKNNTKPKNESEELRLFY